ncbi:MAG: diacylglycerol/lipid kinase family protein [Gemmatimonadota bacterium]
MRTCIILNPGAGAIDDHRDVMDRLERIGDCVIVVTEEPGDEAVAARRAVDRGFERVVACGGDGTVHGVVAGLRNSLDEVVVGMVPLGTANDFARSLGLPLRTDDAIDLIVEGTTRQIDLGAMRRSNTSEDDSDGHLFVNVATGGFGGQVADDVDPETKRTWGPLAYLRTAVEHLRDLQRYRVRLETDEGQVIEKDVYNVVVANGSRAGGNLPVAPRARMDDGLFDVVLVPAVALPELAAVASRIAAGEHGASGRVNHLRTEALRLDAEPAMPFRLDGESVDPGPAELHVLPGALRVVAPEKSG